MPVLKELEEGWFLDLENQDPPYLRDPEGCRYSFKRDSEGALQFYTSRSQLPFEKLKDLMLAYDDWENGRPQAPLPDGWFWRRKDGNSLWSAFRGDIDCYIDAHGRLQAAGVPTEVADVVLSVYKMRNLRPKHSPEPSTFGPEPKNLSRFDTIKKGEL